MLQHASLLMIPKLLIETNRCHWTSYLVAICMVYEVTVFSDIFNADTIANYISEMKDYPIVLAWYWAECSQPHSYLPRAFSKKRTKSSRKQTIKKEISEFSWETLLLKFKNTFIWYLMRPPQGIKDKTSTNHTTGNIIFIFQWNCFMSKIILLKAKCWREVFVCLI